MSTETPSGAPQAFREGLAAILGEKLGTVARMITERAIGFFQKHLIEGLESERRSIQADLDHPHLRPDSLTDARLRGEIAMINHLLKRVEVVTEQVVYKDVLDSLRRDVDRVRKARDSTP